MALSPSLLFLLLLLYTIKNSAYGPAYITAGRPLRCSVMYRTMSGSLAAVHVTRHAAEGSSYSQYVTVLHSGRAYHVKSIEWRIFRWFFVVRGRRRSSRVSEFPIQNLTRSLSISLTFNFSSYILSSIFSNCDVTRPARDSWNSSWFLIDCFLKITLRAFYQTYLT